jgi:hypothetical protein
MTLLLDRAMATGSTLYPHSQPATPGVQAEDFYLRGGDGHPDRRIEIRVAAADGSLRRTWLAAYAEDQVNALFKLRQGWDGYRARALATEAVNGAIELMFTIADELSVPPQLFPLPDGGIQLEWHAAGEDIEIEVDAAGTAHALATNAAGQVLINEEVGASPQSLDAVRAAVRSLSARLAGARRE